MAISVDGTRGGTQTPAMFTFGLGGGGLDPLVLLLIALAIEAVIGEARFLFRVVPHPVRLVGLLTGFLDRKLNREQRSESDRAVRGLLVVLVVGGLSLGTGVAVAWLTQNQDFGWILELSLVAVLISARGLYVRVRAVGLALRDEGLDQARAAVSHIVGRDPSQLDGHGVARGAIESAAENFCDAVVAPVFWYVLFGFPGLCLYKAVNTMDSMIGYRTPRYRAFGMTAARLDDALNLIPARLSGLFLALAAVVVPTARPAAAFKVMLRDSGKHRSMNAGWPEGAVAGALNLALAGPRKYGGEAAAADAWIGDGTARATHRDIRRALYLYLAACLINTAWVAAIAVIRFSPAG